MSCSSRQFIQARLWAKFLRSCLTLCDLWTAACRLLCPWDSPGDTGVDCHTRIQGTQGLLRWQADYLPIAPPGKSLRPAAHQAPLSMGFSRQEHWSGLPFPSPYLSIESSNCFIIICPSKLDSSLMSSVRVASSLKPAWGFVPLEFPSPSPLASSSSHFLSLPLPFPLGFFFLSFLDASGVFYPQN